MRLLIDSWPCPGPTGQSVEFALSFDRGRDRRLLIVPPLLEEMNRTRRMLATTMRELDARGIDSFLPDLPGTNESLQSFSAQSLHGWRTAMALAARHFAANRVLALRGGALVFPNTLPGWVLEPVMGATLLRRMLRTRVLASREAGRHEDSATLLAQGREEGIELAGYYLGPALVAGLESARPLDEGQREIRMTELGGSALWLRAEPGEDAAQSVRLAQIVAEEFDA
ncbi:hypothetical protein Y88_1022 [Novosphingobium nitrogenifigens DSM 19370]|uniref:Uncharacterized protein n=2 Tax=Novosphingobium nitrogenifigens TaxID=378548 RepID=F1Z920_9SPHN|nr:hypothetical protein [Novosphingobium nitrogenifigens]EGD58960.1 hypothetical protein Y88_1022 [Novosphingobium nitrogenifigens DSM 19370]